MNRFHVPLPLILAASASICSLKLLLFPALLQEIKLSTQFVITTSVIFSVWSFWKVFIYPSWIDPLRHLPKAKGSWPIIGHPQIALRRPAQNTLLRFITETPNDGLIRFSGVFNQNYLLLTDPSTLKEVLSLKTYDFEKPTEIRNFLSIILGNGLIVVEGDEHKFQRKHATPAFSFRHIKELYPLFWSKATDLAGRIAAEIHANPEPVSEQKTNHLEGVVEINHWANKATMDIIGVAGLGRDFNTLYNSDDELIASYEEILEPTFEKALFFGANLMFSPRFVAALPWKLNERLAATMGILREVCKQLVRDKKDLLATQKEQQSDILSILIRSNNFADEMLVDQLLTFLAAGHETTSGVFTWGTYLLATHPEIQTRLRDEIRANLPSPSATKADVDFDLASMLENLPFLSAVCNELLRLYPSVPTTMRMAVTPTVIAGTPIPKGTRIYLSMWGINRSPHIWGPDASEFKPERWIDESSGKANNTGGVGSNYGLLTFLHGPRSCIGERFAKSELRALMAVFVGRFAMEMADRNEVPVVAGAITTKPRDGMRLRLRVVEGW